MRKITLDIQPILDWAKKREGVCAVFPVMVSWPELQLTEEQQIANAIARANGDNIPFNDNSMFTVEIGYFE